MDAFSSHSLKKAHQKTTKQLIETCNFLDELKLSHHDLEEKLNERENHFNKREDELQELHRCEIAKGEKVLTEKFVGFKKIYWNELSSLSPESFIGSNAYFKF